MCCAFVAERGCEWVVGANGGLLILVDCSLVVSVESVSCTAEARDEAALGRDKKCRVWARADDKGVVEDLG